jgi:hypothetical protein
LSLRIALRARDEFGMEEEVGAARVARSHLRALVLLREALDGTLGGGSGEGMGGARQVVVGEEVAKEAGKYGDGAEIAVLDGRGQTVIGEDGQPCVLIVRLGSRPEGLRRVAGLGPWDVGSLS